MPNFHSHWLVAYGALPSAPRPVRDGAKTYVDAGRKFRQNLKKALQEEPSLAAIEAAVAQAMGAWKDATARDTSVTCFSAYMLGACGPDFWTVPSKSKRGLIPDMASYLFDLGHYNRTHRQFQVSVSRDEAYGKDLPAQAETAYFCGMATHIAADLVVHQLVNVSAGAYNLLDKHWINEQRKEGLGLAESVKEMAKKTIKGAASLARFLAINSAMGSMGPALVGTGLDAYVHMRTHDDGARAVPEKSLSEKVADSDVKPLWSMHNKVEHYWDTYVRYCCLGDYGPLDVVRGGAMCIAQPLDTLGLPTVEGLLKELLLEGTDLQSYTIEYLSRPTTRYLIEKPLCFPQIYCDRATKGDARLKKTTLFDVVATGANPAADLHPALVKERDVLGGSEESKLAYFRSASNDRDAEMCSWNYLTYYVCPDLAKVQMYGTDFYNHKAFVEFVKRARSVASNFVDELAKKYEADECIAADKVILPRLGNFWNLDTGLGLKVRRVGHPSKGEIVTRLDFVHVFESAGGGGALDAAGQRLFLRPEMERAQFKPKNEEKPAPNAFRAGQRLMSGWMKTSKRTLKQLFATSKPRPASVKVPTDKIKPPPKYLVLSSSPSLALRLRVPIAKLGAKEDELGYFFYADDRRDMDEVVQQEDGLLTSKAMTEDWLNGALLYKKAYLVQAAIGKPVTECRVSEDEGPLQVFSTALRLSLDPDDKDGFRESKYELGRNFAVGTGRRWVLHPENVDGAFNPKEQLKAYENVSPTEQVFFSLYVLVKRSDGKVFEVISGKEIKTDEDYKKLRRIDAAGFVKIVLHYEIGPKGVLHFETCFVDGLEVPVEEAHD